MVAHVIADGEEIDRESEAARITGEIAARILELEELRTGLGRDVVHRLARLNAVVPAMTSTCLELLAGDTSRALASYRDLAAARGSGGKQQVHHEFRVGLERLRCVFPEVAAVITQLRTAAEINGEANEDHDTLAQVVAGDPSRHLAGHRSARTRKISA